MRGYHLGSSPNFSHPQCEKSKDRLHHIRWDYKDWELEDDCVRIMGECINCELEFQKTFQQTNGLTVFAKTTRNVFNFNHDVVELN